MKMNSLFRLQNIRAKPITIVSLICFKIQRNHFQIPPFVNNIQESSANKLRRLQYQSRKRGMLENCILLSTFASKYLPTFDDAQLTMYDNLINLPSNDWDIYYWMTGVRETPTKFDNQVMDLLKKHAKNCDKELRAVQPELFLPN